MTRFAQAILLQTLLSTVAIAQPVASQPADSPATREVDFSKLYTVSEDTTWVTGDVPLTEDGRVNYVEWLRRHYSKGVTRDNNAAVVIVEALGSEILDASVRKESLKQLGFEKAPDAPGWVSLDDYIADAPPPLGEDGKPLPPDEREPGEIARELIDRALAGPWTAEQCSYLVGWCDANASALNKLVEASKRPRYYFPIVPEDGSMLDIILPSLNTIRYAGRNLVVRAMRRTAVGRYEEAWADLMPVRRLARQIGSGPTLIDALVGIALEAYGTDAQRHLLQNAAVSADVHAAWLADLMSLPTFPNVETRVDMCERLTILEVAMLFLGGEPPSEGPRNKRFVIAPETFDWDLVLRRINGPFDEMVAAMRGEERDAEAFDAKFRRWAKNTPEMLRGLEMGINYETWVKTTKLARTFETPEKAREAMSNALAEAILAYFVPAVFRAKALELGTRSGSDLVVLVAALETFKAKEGKYPADLDALAKAKLLKELPTDPFSKDAAGSYIYRATEEGYVLYGRGMDGDDDGGKETDDGDDTDIVYSRPGPEPESPQD